MGDLFDRNVHPLYAVMAFTSALIVALLLVSGMRNRKGITRNHKLMFLWVIFFCIQDGVWGLFASHSLYSDACLFFASNIFHISAVLSALAWTLYFLSRIKDRIGNYKIFFVISSVVAAVQLLMIAANLSSHFMFYVDEHGWYQTTDYRAILFYLQFATYILIGIVSLIGTAREEREETRGKLFAIFSVNLAPLLFGIFQLIYPDAPADSIGFAIGCVIIELFLSRDFESQVFTLEQMQDKLNIALDEAEAANRAKTAFLFNMSHDIRTPMNAILGFTNIAQKHIDDRERVKDSLDKIGASGSQLLNLINEVLEMSRIESGRIEIEAEPGDVNNILDGINPMLYVAAVKKSIDYQVEFGDIRDRYVWVDTAHLDRVLVNVISNAIKYTPDGGKVNVKVEQLAGSDDETAEYLFTVKDSGIGMSREFMDHFFEEFSREQTSTVSKQEGTGLGLSIAKKITDLMGGSIEAESEPGKGSTFRIVIPLRRMTETEAAEQFEEDGNQTAEPKETDVLRGMKVLLVEDNELNREIATDVLEDLGLEITEAEDGSFAVDIMEKLFAGGNREEYFDFILMDIQMPVMNGYEATKKIRALNDPHNTHIPIIAMTANAFTEDKQMAFDSGMDAHLAKPINTDLLIKTLADFAKRT